MDISVIIPVYNVEKYLPKCIESVIGQKGVNFEVILVDDGSTDRCGEICDTYAKKDARIKVIHKKNEGLGYARNEGIEIAQGEFFCFVDSDDWLVEGALAKLYEMGNKSGVDLVWFEAKVVDNQSYRLAGQPEEKQEYVDNEELMKRYLEGMPATVWLKFYKRELFEHIRFSNVPIHEDVYSMHLILKEVKKAIITNQIYYIQYVRPGSLIQTKFSSKNFISIECGKRIVDFTRQYYPQYSPLAKKLLVSRQKGVLEKMLGSGSYKEYRKEFYGIIEDIKTTLQQEDEKEKRTSDTWEYRKDKWFLNHPQLYRYYIEGCGKIRRGKHKAKKCIRKLIRGNG